MPTQVRIPTPLRKLTNDDEVVQTDAENVGAAIADLETRYPGIKERLLDDDGEVRRFVNVYVNEEDIRFLENQDTALKDGDEMSIIPAIAGG
ncbi:MAG: molybdopterin synthase sulfur carrier subunit [Verrucomicrobiales bacterium]|nr:molybdopterin synthase sulfur carrier subunit [Verrucomicrobiales bacterium]